MTPIFKKAFTITSITHLSIISLAFLFSFLTNFSYKKKVSVFTLQSFPSEVVASQRHPPPSPSKTVSKPEIKSSPIKELETPTPPPTTSTSKKISYDEFLKNQSASSLQKPKVVSKTPKTSEKNTVPPSTVIDPPPALKVPSFPSLSATAATPPDELASYVSSIKTQIDLEWQKPKNISGYTQEAIVRFTLNSNGSLKDFHILQSSGSKEFDDSIEKIFTTLYFPPPPPHDPTFELTFNLH